MGFVGFRSYTAVSLTLGLPAGFLMQRVAERPAAMPPHHNERLRVNQVTLQQLEAVHAAATPQWTGLLHVRLLLITEVGVCA